jgi:hypothetical protein
MNLSSRKFFFLALALVIACRESTGPAVVLAQFELTDINGRALPTPPANTPGLTPIILSSTVTLDELGHATIIEHRTQWDGSDATLTSHYTYKITGSQIEFDYLQPCPPNALCAAPPKGTFFLDRLSLEMGRINTDPILYNYHLTRN